MPPRKYRLRQGLRILRLSLAVNLLLLLVVVLLVMTWMFLLVVMRWVRWVRWGGVTPLVAELALF